MHTIERESTDVTTSVAVPTQNHVKRPWTVPAALASIVAVTAVTAIAVGGAAPLDPEPAAVIPVAAVQGESYVVAGGQAPSLASNPRPGLESRITVADSTVPHVVAGGQKPVISGPAVSAPVPHVVSGGQAPVWNTGRPLVEVEPDAIPVWRPTRDKPGGR